MNLFGDSYDMMRAVKCVIQAYILFHHFGGLLYNLDKTKYLQVSDEICAILVAIAWFLFSWLFFESGAHMAKWFFARMSIFKTGSAGHSFVKLTLLFYLEKALDFIPTSYLVIFTYIIYIKFVISEEYQDHFAQDLCERGLVNNLLFISNLWSIESAVKEIDVTHSGDLKI